MNKRIAYLRPSPQRPLAAHTIKSETRNWLRLFVLAGVLSMNGSALAGLQGGPQSCLQDQSGIALNCTAEDVRVASLSLVREIDGCTSPSDTATVETVAHLEINAEARYDLAFFFATDGGQAQTGTCFKEYLPPPLVPGPTDAELASGYGPYWTDSADADLCGDAQQNDITRDPINRILSTASSPSTFEQLELPCRDSDGNGFLDFDYCAGWRNNTKFRCDDISQAGLVQTAAKCKCDTLELPVVVPALTNPPTLRLTKTVMPAGGSCGVDDRDVLNVEVGDSVVYCYLLENPSATAAYDVVLVDDNATAITTDDFSVTLSGLLDLSTDGGLLDLGAGQAATGQSAPMTVSSAGVLENTGLATAVDPNDPTTTVEAFDTALVTAIDPCDYTNVVCANGLSSASGAGVAEKCDSVSVCISRQRPSISVVKTVMNTTGQCGQDDLDFLVVMPGASVRYCYAVTASGDPATTEDIHDVRLVDDNGTPGDPADDFEVILEGLLEIDGDGGKDDLVAGATVYGVSPARLIETARTVTNIATVTGTDPIDQTQLEATDPASVTAEILPSTITVAKTAMVAGGKCGVDDVEPGQPLRVDTATTAVTFCYLVTASGSPTTHEPMLNVSVVDDNATPGDASDDFTVTLTSGVQNLDGGPTANDLPAGGVARGEYTRALP